MIDQTQGDVYDVTSCGPYTGPTGCAIAEWDGLRWYFPEEHCQPGYHTPDTSGWADGMFPGDRRCVACELPPRAPRPRAP